jgi:hypothetical protein
MDTVSATVRKTRSPMGEPADGAQATRAYGRVMTEQPNTSTRPASGGTGLMLTISAATIITVALEAGFIAAASWLLLPGILLVIILMAALVVRAVARVLEDGAVATPKLRPRPVREAPAQPEARRAPARPALGH